MFKIVWINKILLFHYTIFSRMRINQFYCCRLFLKTRGALEKQRVLAERDFHKTLDYGINHRTHHHFNHWKRYQHHWHHQGPLDLRICKFNKRWIRKNYFDGRKKYKISVGFFHSQHFTSYLIVNDGNYRCYCQKNHKCQICKIPMIFSDFEKDVRNKYIWL